MSRIADLDIGGANDKQIVMVKKEGSLNIVSMGREGSENKQDEVQWLMPVTASVPPSLESELTKSEESKVDRIKVRFDFSKMDPFYRELLGIDEDILDPVITSCRNLKLT